MLKILVVTHKEIPLIKDNSLFNVIQVNTLNNPLIYPNILTDATKDNIANKNSNYSELTVSYWMWKNMGEYKYVGLCHYRRVFNFFSSPFSFQPSTTKIVSSKQFLASKTAKISPEKLKLKLLKTLKKYDVILPGTMNFRDDKGNKISISEQYAKEHRKSDFDLIKKITIQKYPKYKDSIKTIFDQGSEFCYGNMFISSKKIWDDYHKWLFDILFEFEKQIEIPKDPYQARIFGFLSERLFTLYFIHNNFKKKTMQVFFIK